MDRNKLIIEKGDRIFARISKNGHTILEFMINCIGSVEELMQEIRRMTGDLRGLVKLCLRNQSRGWGQERLLMLYAGSQSAPAVAPAHDRLRMQARDRVSQPSYALGNLL